MGWLCGCVGGWAVALCSGYVLKWIAVETCAHYAHSATSTRCKTLGYMRFLPIAPQLTVIDLWLL